MKRSRILLTFLSLSAAAQADVSYLVTADTSGIAGTSGYLDFQFTSGLQPSQEASARIYGFQSFGGGGLTGTPELTGAVTGALNAGSVILANTAGWNDYFHAFTYGASFRFLITFSGPAVNSPTGLSASGSTFGLSLYNATGDGTFLTTDPDGFAARVEISTDGIVYPVTYPSDLAGGAPVVTFSAPPPPPTGLPEPSVVFLSLVALAGSATFARRR